MILDRKIKRLQIAFNRSPHEARRLLGLLPATERIVIEVGTPLIKEYGESGIRTIADAWRQRVGEKAYVVADMKCMDRGGTEVNIAKRAGASAATCLGLAPIETIDDFIGNCRNAGLDSMVDMLNVRFPFEILSHLKYLPDIVVLHRGADEKTIEIPYHDINRIKGAYNLVISIAGGETAKDVKRAFFNGADIAVVWRSFNEGGDIQKLTEEFLISIKGYAKRR